MFQVGTILFTYFTTTFTNCRLGKRNKSPIWVVMTCLTCVEFDHLGEHVRKVLYDDDCLCPRILQLIRQFPGAIEGIAVHHRIAGPQSTEHRDRILQEIGHHEGYPCPPVQLQHVLQISAEIAREAVELGEADAGTHVDKGCPWAKLLHRFGKDLAD